MAQEKSGRLCSRLVSSLAVRNEPTSERLRRWRESQGLSGHEAARRADLVQSVWWRIENGERRPSLDQAFAIQELTGGMIAAKDWRKARHKAAKRGLTNGR
jgi:transcriptional regulator with XRE-family HTH domain